MNDVEFVTKAVCWLCKGTAVCYKRIMTDERGEPLKDKATGQVIKTPTEIWVCSNRTCRFSLDMTKVSTWVRA